MPISLPASDSLDKALKAASPGDVIEIEPGEWPGQKTTYDASMEGATEPIRVEGKGAKLMGAFEQWGPQHLELDGLELGSLWNIRTSDGNQNLPGSKPPHHLVCSNIVGKTFLIRNLTDSVFRDSSFGDWDASITPIGPPKVGSYPAEGGAPARLMSRVLFENIFFHDMLRTITGTAHAEGLFFDAGVDGLTFRGCHWTNCAVMSIFSGGQMAGRPITNVLFERCLIDVARNQTGGPVGGTIVLKGGASNWTFRENSILGQGGTLRTEDGSYPGFRFERNAIQNGSYGWIPQSVWEGNVMAVPGNTGSQQANPVGFVSASIAPCDLKSCYRNDLHVKPDSPAGRAGAGVQVGDTPPPPPPPPPPPDPDSLPLTVISQTATEIVLGWTPVPGAIGYKFSRSDQTKVSHTWDGTKASVKFGKGADWYKVEALMPGPSGDWPN